MFRNLPLKIFSLFLAALFWFFIISLESRFVQVPGEVAIQAFNLAPNTALSSKLGTAKIGVRVEDTLRAANLKPGDFEAYVDLSVTGVGRSMVRVSVSSKNPSVSVVRIEPREVEVFIEPLREKLVRISGRVTGAPASGYAVESVTLAPSAVSVLGADAQLKRIARAEAVGALDGTEAASFSTTRLAVAFYDTVGRTVEAVQMKETELTAQINLKATRVTKQVGVRAILNGSPQTGFVKAVEVIPALVSITGSQEKLSAISALETETIDLSKESASFEKVVRLALSDGITVSDGAPTVTIKVTIEK